MTNREVPNTKARSQARLFFECSRFLEDDERQKKTVCRRQSGIDAQPLPVNPGDARFHHVNVRQGYLLNAPIWPAPNQIMSGVPRNNPDFSATELVLVCCGD